MRGEAYRPPPAEPPPAAVPLLGLLPPVVLLPVPEEVVLLLPREEVPVVLPLVLVAREFVVAALLGLLGEMFSPVPGSTSVEDPSVLTSTPARVVPLLFWEPEVVVVPLKLPLVPKSVPAPPVRVVKPAAASS